MAIGDTPLPSSTGYLDGLGNCQKSADIAADSILAKLYPRFVTNTGITTSNAGVEYVSFKSTSGNQLTYYTSNNINGSTLLSAKSIYMTTCDLNNYALNQSGQYNILKLSPEQGALISAAILAVWATAFAFRAIRLSLNSDEREYHD